MKKIILLSFLLFSACSFAQQNFELSCPAGTSPLPFGVTYNSTTNMFRANMCVDNVTGTVYCQATGCTTGGGGGGAVVSPPWTASDPTSPIVWTADGAHVFYAIHWNVGASHGWESPELPAAGITNLLAGDAGIFVNSATHLLDCKLFSGASCMPIGGGTPAPPIKAIQFNNPLGIFAGDALFNYDTANNNAEIGDSSGTGKWIGLTGGAAGITNTSRVAVYDDGFGTGGSYIRLSSSIAPLIDLFTQTDLQNDIPSPQFQISNIIDSNSGADCATGCQILLTYSSLGDLGVGSSGVTGNGSFISATHGVQGTTATNPASGPTYAGFFINQSGGTPSNMYGILSQTVHNAGATGVTKAIACRPDTATDECFSAEAGVVNLGAAASVVLPATVTGASGGIAQVNQCDASLVADFQEATCVVSGITDAAIKTLPTSAVTIVSAPAAGREIIPTVAMISLSRPGGADYTGTAVDGDYLLLTTGTSYAVILNDSAGQAGSNLALVLSPGGVGTTYWPIVISTSPAYPSTAWGALVGAGTNLNSVLISQALTLKATVAGGNFGGGNAANSMKVTIKYVVLPL